jgi:radical SAM/Cys-rich protein
MTEYVNMTNDIRSLHQAPASASLEPFSRRLFSHNLTLNRAKTTTLQINVGLLCNLTCKHCHLEAGPQHLNVMGARTVAQVTAYAAQNRFETIDITGGAPELNPQIEDMIAMLAPLTSRLLIRTNLIAREGRKWEGYIDLCRKNQAVLIASFPSWNQARTDAQRGVGSFARMVESMRKLNSLGYGVPGSPLELRLASNPVGAFLNTPQIQKEKRFREILQKKWGISFTGLYNFNNVPLGRFRRWLQKTGRLDDYLAKLATHFNPCSVSSIMCRSSVSIDWQGYLFDCDFNIASQLYLGGRKIHVTEMTGRPAAGSPIMVGDHCYACTAGAGFTCGGAINA